VPTHYFSLLKEEINKAIIGQEYMVERLLIGLLGNGHILLEGVPGLAKTVQIIQQAENQPRGYYTGVFGIFDGESLQSAVAIRLIEQTDNGLVFRSGGGITVQSDVQEEYRELIQKVYVPLQRG